MIFATECQRGPEKPTSRKVGRALRPDPTRSSRVRRNVPGTLLQPATRLELEPGVFHLVQPGPSAQRDRDADAGDGPSRSGGGGFLGERYEVALAAYHTHPERFVNGPPRPVATPHAVWINPPEKSGEKAEEELH